MTLKEAISILSTHNQWRRYDGPIGEGPEMTEPKILGEAIDTVCDNVLTWEDIKTIVNIADSLLSGKTMKENLKRYPFEQTYYEAVLDKFLDKRK